jgi:hypothetical protein
LKPQTYPPATVRHYACISPSMHWLEHACFVYATCIWHVACNIYATCQDVAGTLGARTLMAVLMSTRSCADSIELDAIWKQESCKREQKRSASSPNNMWRRDGHIRRTQMHDRAYEHEIMRRFYRTWRNLALRACLTTCHDVTGTLGARKCMTVLMSTRSCADSIELGDIALASRLDAARGNQHMRCMYMQAGNKLNSSDESSRNINSVNIKFIVNIGHYLTKNMTDLNVKFKTVFPRQFANIKAYINTVFDI